MGNLLVIQPPDGAPQLVGAAHDTRHPFGPAAPRHHQTPQIPPQVTQEQPRIRLPKTFKRLNCPTCHKSFTSDWGFRVHMNRHRGIFPYHCRFCQKGMLCKVNLVEHERQHTGERLQCPHCDARFTTGRSLTYHVKRVHSQVAT